MASPTARRLGQLVGGLLAGSLAAIVWAASRQQPKPNEPPPPALSLHPDQALGLSGDAPPPAARRATLRPGMWALVVAVSIGVAAATALILRVGGTDAWWLPLPLAGVVLLLAGCVFVFPRLLAPLRAPEDLAGVQGLFAKDRIQFADDRRKLQNDVRTALLQAVVGGAVLIGVLFTWQQQQATSRQVADQLTVARQGQVGERFSRAISQLGSKSMDVRLGGLYELEQLARPDTKAPERRLVIIDVVAAYIREHVRPPANTSEAQMSPPHPPQDVAAALTILGRRPIQDGDPLADLRRAKLRLLNLAGVRFHHADLTGADLSYAKLTGADLRGANLRGANLASAKLGTDLLLADFTVADFNFTELAIADRRTDRRGVHLGADLRGANLTDADLRDANLLAVDLRGANLTIADLTDANLTLAHLTGAHLSAADLPGANLTAANLRDAQLPGADLSAADLPAADLTGANLRDAQLQGANLQNANLTDASLTGADVRGALASRKTRWPGGFDWYGAGIKQES